MWYINSSPPGQNCCHFTDNIFTCISMNIDFCILIKTWWHHQIERFAMLLALCAENSPVPIEFPAQMPVTWSFDVFFYLRMNKQLREQSWGWWSEMPLWSLWCDCNVSLKFVPKGLMDNKAALVQVMAWRRTGAKPLPEPMLIWFLGAYMRLLGEMSQADGKIQKVDPHESKFTQESQLTVNETMVCVV